MVRDYQQLHLRLSNLQSSLQRAKNTLANLDRNVVTKRQHRSIDDLNEQLAKKAFNLLGFTYEKK